FEFLRRAHGLHPHAFRLLLVAMDQYHTRVPFTELPTLRRATALGQIDVWTVKGWVTPEEWLYPHVQAALTAWTLANRPHFAVYRFVGDQWSSRSHEIRDLFSRNGVPFEFHPTDSKRGERLSTSSALMSATYPLPCGTTVRSCTIRAIQSLPFLMGFRSRLRALAMTLWLWVPDRRALQQRSTQPRRGLERSLSSGKQSGVRLRRVP